MDDIGDVIQIHNEPSTDILEQEFERLYLMEQDCDEKTDTDHQSAQSEQRSETVMNDDTPKLDNNHEEEDEEEDGVNVTINLSGNNESERLASLVNNDPLTNVPIICNKNYNHHVMDLEIQKEIEALVRLSISPSTDKNIAILASNQLILVPHDVRISDRLASYAWGHPRPYEPTNIPYASEFDRLMKPLAGREGETFAIFGARYNNTHYSSNEREICGLHQYSEFAAIIISGGKIVDYAVHGYRSNIADMIERHQPRRIYYNAKNQSLTHFLEYKCQPFYQAFQGLLRPLRIHEHHNMAASFNPLSFCERRNIFCALCRCLKDAYGFFNYAKIPTTVRIPQRLKNFALLPSPMPEAAQSSSAPPKQRRPWYHRRRRRNHNYEQELSSEFDFNNNYMYNGGFAPSTSSPRRIYTNDCVKLTRIRNTANRFKGRRNKRKSHSFNTDLEF